MICIYKFTSPTLRVYIGQTVDVYSRYTSHKMMYGNSSPLLYSSFRKYGFDNHVFEIIEECEVEQLNERERYWQEYYDSVKSGLNCKYTKTSDKSGNLSEETKKKIGDAQRGVLNHRYGKKVSKENNPIYGRKVSEETKMKLSLARKGVKKTKEHIENIRKAKLGSKNPMYGTISPNAKLVINLEIGIYYNSVREASESLNLKYSTLTGWLNDKNKNKTQLIYV